MQVEKLYSQLKGLNGYIFFLQEKTEHEKKDTDLKTKKKEQTNQKMTF